MFLLSPAVLTVNDDFVLGCKIVVIESFSIDHVENCRPVFSKMVRVILILIDCIENLVCLVVGRSESEGSKEEFLARVIAARTATEYV